MKNLSDWGTMAGSTLLVTVVIGSWLASIRAQRSTRTISGGWFSLPAWAQVTIGFAEIALFVWLGFALWIPLPLRLSEPVPTVLRSIGPGIFLAGLLLALWARWALGAMYGVSTSSSAPLQEKHRLVQCGPYVFVRHPMYLGYWLVMLGILLTYRTWTPLVLLALTVPSFYRRAQREELALAEQFGEEWEAYRSRVPALLPLRRMDK